MDLCRLGDLERLLWGERERLLLRSRLRDGDFSLRLRSLSQDVDRLPRLSPRGAAAAATHSESSSTSHPISNILIASVVHVLTPYDFFLNLSQFYSITWLNSVVDTQLAHSLAVAQK